MLSTDEPTAHSGMRSMCQQRMWRKYIVAPKVLCLRWTQDSVSEETVVWLNY